MTCPNKNHPEFKKLIEEYGEDLAYYYWATQELNTGAEQSAPDFEEKSTKGKRSKPSFAEYHGDKLKVDAEKDLDTGKYMFKGQERNSVTGDVIKTMQTRPFTATDTYGTRRANQVFSGIPEDQPVKLFGFVAPMTRQEYADHLDSAMAKGMAKGEILHAKIHHYVSKDVAALQRIDQLMEEHGITPLEVDWVDGDIIRAIIEKTGTDYLTDGGIDKLYTEMTIGSEILKWYGTVDMLVDHGDHIYSLFDLKTGMRFNRLFEESFLKYGRTSAADIFDNARNRAQLQLMLYAFIIKVEHPESKFRNLDIIHIKNKWSVGQEDLYRRVNVPAFLEIIENTLKNDNVELYNEIKKLPHFKQLFDPASYSVVTRNQFEDIHANAKAADILKHKMLELQGLIMYDSSVRDLTAGANEDIRVKREKIAELMGQIIELKKDPSVNMDITSMNMGWMDRFLGSASYSTNPYVQMYYKELTKKKQKARVTYEKWVSEHDKLLKALINHKGLKPISRLIGGVDRKALFDELYVTKEDANKKVINRLIISTDPEFQKLSPQAKAYLNFVNNSISGVFKDEYAHLIDPDFKSGVTKPLANRVVAYRNWRGKKDVPVTNLDLHNKLYSIHNLESEKNPFSYYEGFFPKMAPKIDDIMRKHGGLFNEGTVKFLWNRYVTNYFETEYDQWENNEEAIPMKYLGNEYIDEGMNYTFDLESSVKGFIKHHIYKAQMDEVYAMGQAIKIYLDAQKAAINAGPDPDKNDHVNRLIAWFEDSINLHILGRKNIELTASSRGFGVVVKGKYQKFSWAKFLRSLKNFFAGPTMWLKPLSGLPNAVFASLVTLKEGLKGSLGISTSNTRFTLSDIAAGFGEAFMLYAWNGMSNNAFRNNKTYLLMEKFGYLPDNSDWYTSNNELMTARNQLFTSRTMMMFHSVPEEVIATAIFVAQLKAMKFKKQDGTETTVWDSYKDVDETLSDGSKHTNIVWTGGVRGKRKASNIIGDKDYEDVTELTIEEINAIKFLYEKIHGGYRGDERTAAEYYVMGELFIQMKRYMPAILKNVWASKGVRQTQGYFEEVVDENGEKIMKWKPQVIEGRYKVLIGLLLNYLSIKHVNGEGKRGNRFKEMLGLQFDSVNWDKLEEAQKEDVKDFLLTTVMYVLLIMGRMKLWDEDEDDAMKRIYQRIANDFAGNVNPLEIIKNIKNATVPTAVNRGYQLLEGITEMTWATMLIASGHTDEALTQQGNLRGSANVKRNIHFISAWYDITHKLEDSKLFEEYLK